MREQAERLELGELAPHRRRRHVHARSLDERLRPDGLAGRDVLLDHPPQDLAPAGGELFHPTNRTRVQPHVGRRRGESARADRQPRGRPRTRAQASSSAVTPPPRNRPRRRERERRLAVRRRARRPRARPAPSARAPSVVDRRARARRAAAARRAGARASAAPAPSSARRAARARAAARRRAPARRRSGRSRRRCAAAAPPRVDTAPIPTPR